MSNEKHYIGRGYQKDGSAYVILHLDLNALQVADFYQSRNGRMMVKAVLAKRRNPSVGGTHVLYVVPAEDYEQRAQDAIADKQELELREH